jgi:chromosome segregation ATPase
MEQLERRLEGPTTRRERDGRLESSTMRRERDQRLASLLGYVANLLKVHFNEMRELERLRQEKIITKAEFETRRRRLSGRCRRLYRERENVARGLTPEGNVPTEDQREVHDFRPRIRKEDNFMDHVIEYC